MELRTRVLIIDNDPDVLFTLRTVFEAEGFDVALAADGTSAMRRLGEARPDVIVLDVAMPVLDGWYVLAELAGMTGAPPVIVTSAKGHPLDVARAHALGACGLGVPRRQEPCGDLVVGQTSSVHRVRSLDLTCRPAHDR